MPGKLNIFWQELKRRKVLRVITVYAAVAFVILQLVEILAPSLRLPDWTMNFILVLLIVGFIITVIASWVYDATPEGIVKTEPAHKVKKEDISVSSKGWKIASYISFVVIVALIVLNIIPRTSRSDIKEILDKSIAVLPLEYLSANPDNEYLANGVLDAITGHLSLIKGLRVMPRTSIEQYRENKKTAKEIGEELDVSYLVEGSFQMVDNQVKLIIQLVLAEEGDHIFFREYDRNYSDIFAVQSEVAQTIAKEIEVAITPEVKQRIEKIPTTNLTAYDFYQRGRAEYEDFWLSGFTEREALERAEDLYYKALEYDSTFALAYTGLARVYWSKRGRATYLSENYLDSVLILADKALSFDNQLSEAFTVKGSYYKEHNKKEQAIKEYDKAIKFNPNEWMAYIGKGGLYFDEADFKNTIENYYKALSIYRGPLLSMIYRSLGYSFSWAGFREESEKFSKEALALDDDSAEYYSSLANSESDNGNFNKGIEYFERSIAIDSTDWTNYQQNGNSYTYLGQFEEALVYYKKAYEITQANDNTGQLSLSPMFRLGQIYLNIGKEEEATYYLNRVREFYIKKDSLDRRAIWSEITEIHARAGLYTCLGDKDKAFEYLRLLNQKQHFPAWLVIQLKVDPLFNSIRDEPEFQQILADIEAKYQAEHERVRQWLEENEML